MTCTNTETLSLWPIHCRHLIYESQIINMVWMWSDAFWIKPYTVPSLWWLGRTQVWCGSPNPTKKKEKNPNFTSHHWKWCRDDVRENRMEWKSEFQTVQWGWGWARDECVTGGAVVWDQRNGGGFGGIEELKHRFKQGHWKEMSHGGWKYSQLILELLLKDGMAVLEETQHTHSQTT